MTMPPRLELLRVAREILASDVDYDPEHPRMNIARNDVFRYHVSMALWELALHPDPRPQCHSGDAWYSHG